MLSPQKIIELERGIEATFEDGHTASLSFNGKTCTCCERQGMYFCPHIAGALAAYKDWKWRKVDGNETLQGVLFCRSVGIDPRIFNPPTVDWRKLDPDTYLVWRRLWGRQSGWLFQFYDGAFFALVDEHPDGMTKCSLCRVRDCRHVRDALEQLKRAETAVAV